MKDLDRLVADGGTLSANEFDTKAVKVRPALSPVLAVVSRSPLLVLERTCFGSLRNGHFISSGPWR